MSDIGHKRWAIAEGFIPSGSVSQDHDLVSHEAVCMLNASKRDAEITIMLYFEHRGPVGPYRINLGAERTLHLRFNDLEDPAPVPRDISYASLIEADVPIVVQHTRLDSRHPNIALLSTIGHHES